MPREPARQRAAGETRSLPPRGSPPLRRRQPVPAAVPAARLRSPESGAVPGPGAAGLHLVYTRLVTAETTTIRVRRPDSERLRLLARDRQKSVIDVLHDAIDALERREFLRSLTADYQSLRNKPELWQRYLAERSEWDPLA